jgi:hypothetical protein
MAGVCSKTKRWKSCWTLYHLKKTVEYRHYQHVFFQTSEGLIPGQENRTRQHGSQRKLVSHQHHKEIQSGTSTGLILACRLSIKTFFHLENIEKKHNLMARNIITIIMVIQDTEINTWSNKSARAIIKIGVPFISALAKGMQSKVKGTSQNCLLCTAWLGSELAALGENAIRYSACEILLHDIASHLHPGNELDERVLACMCLYNYTSGKGK